jgi:hypothetical protein
MNDAMEFLDAEANSITTSLLVHVADYENSLRIHRVQQQIYGLYAACLMKKTN